MVVGVCVGACSVVHKVRFVFCWVFLDKVQRERFATAFNQSLLDYKVTVLFPVFLLLEANLEANDCEPPEGLHRSGNVKYWPLVKWVKRQLF